jgi:murein L,D-transpeptidase YcbB/YkuD
MNCFRQLAGLLWCLFALTSGCEPALSQQVYADEIRSRIGPADSMWQVYAGRNFAPLWIQNDAVTSQAISLVRTMCSAERYGLRAIEYLDCAGFEQMLQRPASPGPRSPLVSSAFDTGLTTAAMRFLSDIHFGRVDPRKAGFDFGIPRKAMDYGYILNQLATASDIEPVLAAVEPQFEHYRLLKQALARYRSLDSGQAVATRAELHTAPYDERIRQIELTLERWRWLPDFNTPPILVNIPQFRLFAFQSTRDLRAEILQMDVIVGRSFPKLQTPVFAADLKYVVFRPYWDIPYSIVKKEMLPQLRSKSDFWRKQHLELVAGPGDAAPVVPFTPENLDRLEAGKLRLRQQPGTDNALGLIKFMLPNAYNVYLHSTPAHHLFARSSRAFSHGCIRVSDPVALAAQVLRNAGGNWTPEAITAAMNGTETFRVNLKTPIRVLIVYATALAQEDGSILFFNDIYGHDRRLESLLAQPTKAVTQSAMIGRQ